MSETPTLPRVADLWGIINALSAHPDHAKFVSLAERAQRAQSCIADLALAQSCHEVASQMANLEAGDQALHLNAINHSLIANAVILYARATSTHSAGGERGSVSIDDRLPPEQLQEHRVLIDLRNRVIAHVHAGEMVGDSVWHTETMLLREVGEEWLPGCATRRVQGNPATVRSLALMIPVASNLIRQTFFERLARLTEALNAVPLDVSLIEEHVVDPELFFGKGAADALAPPPGGSAMGMMWTPKGQ